MLRVVPLIFSREINKLIFNTCEHTTIDAHFNLPVTSLSSIGHRYALYVCHTLIKQNAYNNRFSYLSKYRDKDNTASYAVIFQRALLYSGKQCNRFYEVLSYFNKLVVIVSFQFENITFSMTIHIRHCY